MYIKKSFSLYLFLPEIPVESRGNSQNDYRMDNIPVIPAGTCGSFLLRRRCAEYQTLYFSALGASVIRLTAITTIIQNRNIQPQKNNQFRS